MCVLCVCLGVLILMVYEGIVILLYGFFKSNLFDKVTYQMITSEFSYKITFSSDDRIFASHVMSNSRWTAGFTTVM